EKGLTLAAEFLPDVVLMDQNLPGMSGQEATQRLVERVLGVKVVMITAFGAINLAVDAMRRGAYDYLTKPFDNDELLLRVRRAMEARRLADEVESLREALGERYSFEGILGESEALRGVLHAARRAAQSDVPVLVEGESGTGKELLVRAIHHASRRSAGPFVAVNCAAVPDHLVESEFFGHEKGAFTDARSRQIGRFEQAHGGTLFLDEISEMPVGLQAKLLRALEEGEVSRVGSSAPVRVDVRVIAATNLIAAEAVKNGVLREDLYHRLAVVSLRIPPLRERREDIPLLARQFLTAFDREAGNPSRDFSADALASLKAYGWPGNIRELRNAVQSAAIMAEGIIRSCDLPPHVERVASTAPPRAGTLAEAVEAVERRLIAETLAQEGGNRTRAAERLAITRKTLLAKIAQYGL
ncbi:MAG: hypothetical protein A3F84_27490, partial [Candidatus Handelsmanbacteria bacterium RIFCSPLOWO2_12_FULL_64_10]